LYVASGLGGSLAGLLRTQDVVSVGASGGIWGLMVAGAVLVTWPRGRLPALVAASQRNRAWAPVGINAFYSLQPGIDWLAHLGGGIIGGLLMLSGVLTVGIPVAAAPHDGAARHASSPARTRDPVVVRALALLAAALVLISVVISLGQGRPWELRSSPSLGRVKMEGSDATIELPRLITPPHVDREHYTWTFGGLKYDPLGFVISFSPGRLTEDQAAHGEEQLKAIIGEVKPELLEGATLTTPNELRKHDGEPYLYSQQTMSDKRTADTYWLIRQERFARVIVIAYSSTPAPWRAAAGEVPFSIAP
jgi:rhomboid protease GluP